MKKILILFIPLLIGLNKSNAQVILPLGLGQVNSLNVTCSNGDKLWVISDEQKNFEVNKWDGNFWIRYNSIPAYILSQISSNHDSIEAKAIEYHNGELYAAFAHKNSGKLLLIKSGGRNWNIIKTDKIAVEKNLEFVTTRNNDLLLCGKIIIDKLLISVLKVSEADCSIFAESPAYLGINDYYTDFESSGNKLYAIGLFQTPTDPYNKYFTVFENKTWNIINNPPFANGFEGIGKFNDSLVIAGIDHDGKLAFSIQNNGWREIANGLDKWQIKSVSDIHQVGNKLWVSGRFYNAVKNQDASLVFWDYLKWTIPSFDYIGNDIKINGSSQVLISGSFIKHQDLLLNTTGVLDFGSSIVAGKVFYDLNQNCTQDDGEETIQGITLTLHPEEVSITTDLNGRYVFPVDSSKMIHVVEIQTPKYNLATCPLNGIQATKKEQGKFTLANVDFGIIPSGNHIDAEVAMYDYTGWRARQGFDEQYKICVTNRGTKTIESCKLVLNSDKQISNWAFSQQADLIQNNTYEWKISSLKASENYCIKSKANIPVQIALDSKITFETKIFTTDIQDEDQRDNVHQLTQKIVAAIDPNDKSTKQGYFILPGTDVIDYKIRFQNTGSDTAYGIEVIDTVDKKLSNLLGNKSLRMSTSHPYKLNPKAWRSSDGIYNLKYAWRFNDILLPDINTNEELSHGFIDFKLELAEGLSLGTTIRNRAFIFFDYQEPILTNTAINVVSLNTGIKSLLALNQLSIYPNPAKDKINITNPSKITIHFNLINTLGQTILSKSVAPESNLLLETTGFAKGLYLINAEGFAPVKVLIH